MSTNKKPVHVIHPRLHVLNEGLCGRCDCGHGMGEELGRCGTIGGIGCIAGIRGSRVLDDVNPIPNRHVGVQSLERQDLVPRDVRTWIIFSFSE